RRRPSAGRTGGHWVPVRRARWTRPASTSRGAATGRRPVRSLARELRWTLLEEGREGLREVVGGEEGGVPHTDVVETFFDTAAFARLEHGFGALDGEGRVRGDLTGHLVRRLVAGVGVRQHL